MLNPSLTNLGLNVATVKTESMDKGDNAMRFGLQMGGGYAVIDNLVVTANLGFQTVALNEKSSEGKYSGGMFDFMPGVRYYAFQGLYAFTNFGMAFGSLKNKYMDLDWETDEEIKVVDKYSLQSLQLQLGVGYDFFVTKSFAIEPSISYAVGLYTRVKGDGLNKKINMGLFSVNLGFVYVFGRDKYTKPSAKKKAPAKKKK